MGPMKNDPAIGKKTKNPILLEKFWPQLIPRIFRIDPNRKMQIHSNGILKYVNWIPFKNFPNDFQ